MLTGLIAADPVSGCVGCAGKGCGKSEGVKKCGGCCMVAFCGKGCQKSIWAEHRSLCAAVKSGLFDAPG